MSRTVSVYTDGGIIFDGGIASRSIIGGTWYYCVVEEGEIIDECGGVLRPIDIDPKTSPPVTNNITELYALTSAIQSVWPGVHGEKVNHIDRVEPDVHLLIHTDSNVSLQRVRNHLAAMENVPDWLIEKVRVTQNHLQRFLSFKFILLQGHPTREDLRTGIGKKRNLPVSKFNVYCDANCHRVGQEYMEEQ